jgi:hypothetical protein
VLVASTGLADFCSLGLGGPIRTGGVSVLAGSSLLESLTEPESLRSALWSLCLALETFSLLSLLS